MPKKNEHKCAWCGKTLPKYWTVVADRQRDPVETKKGKPSEYYKFYDQYFYGNYGYCGNNHFCTLRCGYSLAVKIMNKSQENK